MKAELEKRNRKWLRALLILLLLILTVILTVFGYVNAKLNRISYDHLSNMEATPVPTIDVEAAAAEGIILPKGEANAAEKVVNILLLGTDLRLPGTSDPGRADSTMLCSLNLTTGEVKLVSFERGIFVPIPEREADLLTHAYHWGGAELSQSIIEQCFLLDLAGYAQVDVERFVEIIDAIGGVDIELTGVEAYVLNGRRGSEQSENALHEGINHLNGSKALAYCRLRSTDDDWKRQQRQRNTIKACLAQLKTLSVREVDQLANIVLPMIHTNLSKGQIASLLLNAPKFIRGEVSQLQVPDRNMTNFYIKCDFDYESKKISNFIYETDYELNCPY